MNIPDLRPIKEIPETNTLDRNLDDKNRNADNKNIDNKKRNTDSRNIDYKNIDNKKRNADSRNIDNNATTIQLSGSDFYYEVIISRQAINILPEHIRRLGAEKIILIAELGFGPKSALADSGISAIEIDIEPGETAKSWQTVGKLLEQMAQLELRRTDCVVGVGGGRITDIAGFAAATYLRGIKWIACPTTVLGAVDAAIGGKTGVNLAAGKNLAGAFWQPSAVIVDTDTFKTLPERQISSGLAEVIKCGFIADPTILETIQGWGNKPDLCQLVKYDKVQEVVAPSVQVKADVVCADTRESGLRAILNYGHTLGHGLEHATDFALTHGEAISIGMVFAAQLSVELGLIQQVEVENHKQILSNLGLPISERSAIIDKAKHYMRVDKKNAQTPRYVVLEEIGKATIVDDPPQEHLNKAFDAVRN